MDEAALKGKCQTLSFLGQPHRMNGYFMHLKLIEPSALWQ